MTGRREHELLLTPGPVMVPEEVLHACSLQPMYHRSRELLDTARSVWSGLQVLLATNQPVVLLGGSAMTGMEAVQASAVSHGSNVLAIVHGRFGERLAEISRRYGCITDALIVPWGDTISPEHVDGFLRESTTVYSAVWLVHAETSTGVTLDLRNIASVIRSYLPNTLICVDAVLSVGIEELYFDAWDLDAVVFGSQKGLMCPPGITGIALSARAIESISYVTPRSYTMDLQILLRDYMKGTFTWTPPVTLLRALDASLQLIHTEGIQNVWTRTRSNRDFLHTEMIGRGIALYGHGSSNGVTAIADMDAEYICSALLREFNIRVAAGQDQLSTSVFRVATCGMIHTGHLQEFLDAYDRVSNSTRRTPTLP